MPALATAAITRLISTDDGNFGLLGIVVSQDWVFGRVLRRPLRGASEPEKTCEPDLFWRSTWPFVHRSWQGGMVQCLVRKTAWRAAIGLVSAFDPKLTPRG